MITISDLTRYYGTFLAVDHISFEVQKGEILGFLGPNGAGKTTTMKIITGYMLPTSGNITIDGLDVVHQSMEIRKKIGYLPEHNALYLDMGIMEYLTFVMNARHIEKANFQSRLSYVIEVCGLKEMLKKNIGELSKGFRQRVGLAQALIHNPEILVLDEPTVGLDPNQIVEIRNLIKEIGKEKTIILSTHILPEVEVTCNRVIIINNGTIAAMGTTADLQRSSQAQDKIRLVFSGDQPQWSETFRQIGGVNTVAVESNETETVYSLDVDKDIDPRTDLMQIIVKNNLPLLEIKREQISLEDVFHQLTLRN
ncbi:MAG: ATP-binding cassette domain-containing protein [Candidatus Delongbacteria bacterium]|nr:ATP-binding cassette domain-containing protein [Candidatus Delongbacteria bacterium]